MKSALSIWYFIIIIYCLWPIEGGIALYHQVSNGNFWLPLASNWLNFIVIRQNILIFIVTIIFGKKIAWCDKFSWFFYCLKESVHFIVMHLELPLTSFVKNFYRYTSWRYPHYYPRYTLPIVDPNILANILHQVNKYRVWLQSDLLAFSIMIKS